MTDSYNQGDINLRSANPISVQSPAGIVGLVIDLGTIEDGNTLVVNLWGGGSEADPALINANNYAVREAVGVFTRVAGSGAVQPGPITLVVLGIAVGLVFVITDNATTTDCQLTIIVPASDYIHRLQYSTIQF